MEKSLSNILSIHSRVNKFGKKVACKNTIIFVHSEVQTNFFYKMNLKKRLENACFNPTVLC